MKKLLCFALILTILVLPIGGIFADSYYASSDDYYDKEVIVSGKIDSIEHVIIDGYYDENGNYIYNVETNDGYYDENGYYVYYEDTVAEEESTLPPLYIFIPVLLLSLPLALIILFGFFVIFTVVIGAILFIPALLLITPIVIFAAIIAAVIVIIVVCVKKSKKKKAAAASVAE